MRPAVIALLLVWSVGAQPDSRDWTPFARRAVEQQQAGDYAGAADNYRRVLSIKPDDVATHVNLGVVLVRLGRFDEAIGQYEAADKLLPGDSRIELNLGLAYEKSGRFEEAAKRFNALHASQPQDIKVTMLLADCRLQMGDNRGVVELLQPLAAERPDDLGIAYMLGMAFLREQRVKEAQAQLDRILRNGDSAEARFLLGTRMFEAGDYPAAVKQLAGAIELNPLLPQLHSLYGRALLNTGDPDGASLAFRKELETNANDYGANLGLAQISIARRDVAAAMPYARRALASRPDSAEAKLVLAECLSGARLFAEARSYAEAAAQTIPASLEAHRTLLAIYTGLRLTSEAARERAAVRRLEAAALAADPGPKPHESAPEFELPDASSSKPVRLRDFRGKSAVTLVFGSYSCPNFRDSAAALKRLQQRYGGKVPFLLVYIREAHAEGDWQSTRNERAGLALKPAATLGDKREHAMMCSRELHLPFPAIVDTVNGAVETAYNAWPSRVFVIDVEGRVLYSSRLTELDFHPEEMEAALRKAAAKSF